MAFQKEIRQFQTSGIVGDIIITGAIRAQAGVLNSTAEANNIIGRAMTHAASKDDAFTVGGAGAFAGILSSSKLYANYGIAGAALSPSLVVANNTVVEGVTMTSGILVDMTTTANIGDNVAYKTATGELVAAPAGVAPSGSTLIPNSKVVRVNLAKAGLAIIELTE